MTEQRVSLRYAKAVFELAKSVGTIDIVYKDFSVISDYLKASGELLKVMKSPVVKSWRKKQLLQELFGSLISQLSLTFILLLADKNRENFLPDILASYEKMYLSEMNIIKAVITTARELDDTLKAKIISELTTRLEKTIIPTYKVEPSIKGGIMIRVEDWVYDATVRNQLSQLRTTLIEGKLV